MSCCQAHCYTQESYIICWKCGMISNRQRKDICISCVGMVMFSDTWMKWIEIDHFWQNLIFNLFIPRWRLVGDGLVEQNRFTWTANFGLVINHFCQSKVSSTKIFNLCIECYNSWYKLASSAGEPIYLREFAINVFEPRCLDSLITIRWNN